MFILVYQLDYSAFRAQPRISSSVFTPWASIHCAISSAMVSMARGLAKFAAPTCTAVAPAMMNSSASRPVAMPPRPTTGMFTAPTACQTMRRAMGRTAGPDRPAKMLLNTGLRFSRSMAQHVQLVITECAGRKIVGSINKVTAEANTRKLYPMVRDEINVCN